MKFIDSFILEDNFKSIFNNINSDFFKNYDEEMLKYFNDKMAEEGWDTSLLNNQSASLSVLDGIKTKVD